MNLVVVGSGYVGLVSGACLADKGHRVICVDISEERIEGLKGGKVPIYEPGLDAIIARNAAEFDTTYKAGIYISAGLVLFVLTFAVNALARIVAERGKAKS